MNGEIEPQLKSSSSGLVGRIGNVLRNDAKRLFTTGVPHLFAAMALTQGISIFRRILLARILSVEELGQMTYVMQIADFIVIFADIGICTSVLKYVAEPGDEERKREFYCTGLVSGALSSIVVAMIYMAVALSFHFHDDRSVRIFMLMVVPYIPLAAVVKTPLVFMQARKEIKRAANFTAITQALGLAMLVVATHYYHLWGFFFIVTFAPLSNLTILLLVTRQHLRLYWPSWQMYRKLVSFGFFSMLANATGFANAATAVVLLRKLSGSDAQVGYYAVALMVMTGMRLLPTTLMGAAFPYLSGLLNEPAKLQQRMRELAKKQFLVVLMLVLGWCLFGGLAVRIVFGLRYQSSFQPSMVLLLGLVAYSYGITSAYVMTIYEKVRLNFCVSLMKLVMNVLLCYLLIPRYGLMGAALSVSISECASCITVVLSCNLLLARLVPAERDVSQR